MKWYLNKDTGVLTISGTGDMDSFEETGLISVATTAPWSRYDFRFIKSIVINNSVTSIGSYAFYGLIGLESIVIPESVMYISYEAFGRYNGVIKCHENSYAHDYAKKNNFKFELIQ